MRTGFTKNFILTALTTLSGIFFSTNLLADIDIKINGIEENLKKNVLIFLSLERYKNRDDLELPVIRQLQERAESEISAAIRPFGYYESKVGSSLEKITNTDWQIKISVEPGKQITMGLVTIKVLGEGSELLEFQDIENNISLHQGAALNHTEYELIKNNLQRMAITLGFPEAVLSTSELFVNPDSYTASATIILETGPRYNFGKTTINQDTLEPSLMLRYLRYTENKPYNSNEILLTQFALDDSLYFSTVEVIPQDPDTTTKTIPVSITTTANNRNHYSIGAGYASDTEARGIFSWDNRRINDRGHRLRTEVKAAQLGQSLEMQYVVPLQDPAIDKLSFEFRQSRDSLGDLDTRTTRLKPSVMQLRGRWQRSLFASFSRLQTITAATNLQARNNESNTLIIPGASYASVPSNYLGEALYSREFFAELRGSIKSLGAQSNYLQLRIEGEKQFRLSKNWHYFLRAQIGSSLVSRTTNIPGTERFFAGGDRSVRGFGYNELSPLDTGGANIGGRHMLVGAVEIIRDLPHKLALATFVDVGNAFDRFGDPLQYSVGLGLRYRTRVVTIGIDIAQPLTNPACHSTTPDARCISIPGFDARSGPRLHINFAPTL